MIPRLLCRCCREDPATVFSVRLHRRRRLTLECSACAVAGDLLELSGGDLETVGEVLGVLTGVRPIPGT